MLKIQFQPQFYFNSKTDLPPFQKTHTRRITVYYLRWSRKVMFGVVKMIDFRDAQRLYHLSKPDFFLWNISFWVTVIVGPIEGIGVSLTVR